MKLTNEQEDILYSENENIYVLARAGTGKTKTLLEYTKIRKQSSFLYIVYNDSIRKEALQKFPSYVKIHTIHSLAYSIIGKKYSHKLKMNLKVEDIFMNATYFKNKDISDEETYKKAFTVMKILNGFFNSALKSLDEIEHLEEYLIIAKEYWEKMQNIENKKVFMTSDGYLKMYHLTNPILKEDYLLIDEAQDSNEVMLDIIYSQKGNKIFVGDEHQRIYSFRGAINVFDEEKYFSKTKDNKILSLTKSFRFGKEIAEKANKLLTVYKKEKKLLVGSDINSFVGYLDRNEQYTSICRTNSLLFDLAINHVREGKKIHIIGGTEYIFNQIKDIYYLLKGEHDLINSDYIRTFKNYNSFKGMAKALKIPEYIFLVKIIEKYGENINSHLKLINRNIVNKKIADIILTTAHKSKGLEFISVKIENDFIRLYDENGKLIPKDRIDEEEINLLYVAITRATEELELNKDLEKLL